jgi:hypothetical protein
VWNPERQLCEWVLAVGVADKYGHALDGDWDPKGRNGCSHVDSPEWKAAHRAVKTQAPQVVPQEVAMEEVQPAEAHPAATVAAVGVPAGGVDISAIMPKDGNASVITVLLALIVVVGGLAWKFLPGHLKALNEREAKKLELEEQRIGIQQNQQQGCEQRHLAVEQRVADLDARVAAMSAKVEQSASLTAGGGDYGEALEEMASRVSKVERAVKTLKAKL